MVADVVTWSMRWCLKGRFPPKGMFGESFTGLRLESANKEIAEGYRFAYFGFKADAKARKECHQFDRSYQHTQICETCLAEKPCVNGNPDMNYKDFFNTAPHLMTGLSHMDYVSISNQVTPWIHMPGFNVKTCFRDPMHTIFLGTAKELLASTLGYWSKSGLLEGTSLGEQLRWFSHLQHKCCKENGLKGSFKTYTPSNTGLCTNSEFPELGSSFKAASIKISIWYFAKFAAELSTMNREEPTVVELDLWKFQVLTCSFFRIQHITCVLKSHILQAPPTPGLRLEAYLRLPLEFAKRVGAYGSQRHNLSKRGG